MTVMPASGPGAEVSVTSAGWHGPSTQVGRRSPADHLAVLLLVSIGFVVLAATAWIALVVVEPVDEPSSARWPGPTLPA